MCPDLTQASLLNVHLFVSVRQCDIEEMHLLDKLVTRTMIEQRFYVVPMLQLFFVCAFVLSLFVPHLSFLWCLGRIVLRDCSISWCRKSWSQRSSRNICTRNLRNVPYDISATWRLKSSCISAQSDQGLRCTIEEILHRWLSKMRPVKILIKLCEWAGWSESSLSTYTKVRLLTTWLML